MRERRPKDIRQYDTAPAGPSSRALRWFSQRMVLKPLVWSLTSVTVTGESHLAALNGPFVLVANHSSHLDTPLLLGSLPGRLGTTVGVGAAADYFFDARWRAILTGTVFNAFPVARNGSGRRGLAASLLKTGQPVMVFPEGTRSRDGEMHEFTAGAAALCIKQGVACLPVGLRGAYAAMPRGRNWPVRGRPRVQVSFGAPMYPAPDETAGQFTARIAASVAALRGAGPNAATGGRARAS